MSYRNRIRHGKAHLVVVGSSKHGFRLAALSPNKETAPFGETFARQSDALDHGESKFGKRPAVVRSKK